MAADSKSLIQGFILRVLRDFLYSITIIIFKYSLFEER